MINFKLFKWIKKIKFNNFKIIKLVSIQKAIKLKKNN